MKTMTGTPAKRILQHRLAITVDEIGLFLCTRADPIRGIKAFLASPLELHESQNLLDKAISEELDSEVTAKFFAPDVAREIAALSQVTNGHRQLVEQAFRCGQKLAFLRLIAGKVPYFIYRNKRVKRSQSEGGKKAKEKSDARWKKINMRFLKELRKKPRQTKDAICCVLSEEFGIGVETLKGRLRLPDNREKVKPGRGTKSGSGKY